MPHLFNLIVGRRPGLPRPYRNRYDWYRSEPYRRMVVPSVHPSGLVDVCDRCGCRFAGVLGQGPACQCGPFVSA
jgi:hypothetical protein